MIRARNGPLLCRLFFAWMHLIAISCIISAVVAEEYGRNGDQKTNNTDEIDWQKWAEWAEQLWYLPIILFVTLVPFVLVWLIIQIIGISWFANALHLRYRFAAKEPGDVLSCEASRHGKYLVEISYVRPCLVSEKDTPTNVGYHDGKAYRHFRKTIEMDRWVEPGDAAIEMLVLRNQPTSGMPAEIINRNIEEFSQLRFVCFSMFGIALIGYMLYLEVQLVLYLKSYANIKSLSKTDWIIFGVYNALTLLVSIAHYKKSVREKIEQMNTSLPSLQEKKITQINKKKIKTVNKCNLLLAGGIVVPDCILPATRPLPYKLEGDDVTDRASDGNQDVSLMARARDKTVDPVVFVLNEEKPRRKDAAGWLI